MFIGIRVVKQGFFFLGKECVFPSPVKEVEFTEKMPMVKEQEEVKGMGKNQLYYRLLFFILRCYLL